MISMVFTLGQRYSQSETFLKNISTRKVKLICIHFPKFILLYTKLNVKNVYIHHYVFFKKKRAGETNEKLKYMFLFHFFKLFIHDFFQKRE